MNRLAHRGAFVSFPKILTNARQLPGRGKSMLAHSVILTSLSFCGGSRVEGSMSRVEGTMSRVIFFSIFFYRENVLLFN